ncbi:MAG TPA: PHP domain-containing protein [Candidatus Obscuribacterales bacterium]
MAVNVVYESTDHRAAQDVDALRQVFEHFTATSCPRSYNFHLHTTCSDGRLSPRQVIDQAIALGLKGLAITDHHSVRGYDQAQAYLAQVAPADSQPRLWTGMEISAGLLDNEVHILCYGFEPSHTALKPYLQQRAPRGLDYEATQVINAVHQAGGLAVLAHPDRYRRSPQDLIDTAATLGIDGVEVFYAYNNPSPWTPSPRQTRLIQDLANQYGLLKTGGTDTHGLSLLQRI